MSTVAYGLLFSAVVATVVAPDPVGKAEWEATANQDVKNAEFDYVKFQMKESDLKVAQAAIPRLSVSKFGKKRQRRDVANNVKPMMQLFLVEAERFTAAGDIDIDELKQQPHHETCSASTLEHPQAGITAAHCFRARDRDVLQMQDIMEFKPGKAVQSYFLFAMINNDKPEQDQQDYMRVVTAWWYPKAWPNAYKKEEPVRLKLWTIVDYAFIWLDKPIDDAGAYYTLFSPDHFKDAEVEATGFKPSKAGEWGYVLGERLSTKAKFADTNLFRQNCLSIGKIVRGCSGGPWIIENSVTSKTDKSATTGKARLVGVFSGLSHKDDKHICSFVPTPAMAKAFAQFLAKYVTGFKASASLKTFAGI